MPNDYNKYKISCIFQRVWKGSRKIILFFKKRDILNTRKRDDLARFHLSFVDPSIFPERNKS